MRRHYPLLLPPLLLQSLLLLPLALLPLPPAAAQFNSMGGNGLDSYGYDSGGSYHGSSYGSSPNYMVTGPSDADMAKLQSQLQRDFAIFDRHDDPPSRRWSDDHDYTPPPPPPPHVPSFMEKMQARADAGDKEALRYLADDILLWDRGDYSRAVNFYQKAIDAGDTSSMIPLYHLLLDQKRGVEDIPRAAKMLPMLAAECGSEYKDLYGKALIAGDGFPKDASYGIKLRVSAAAFPEGESGDIGNIRYALAKDYETGNGFDANADRAIYWYSDALDAQGDYPWKPDAAARVCALILAENNGLYLYRDRIVSLLTGWNSSLPAADKAKLVADFARSLAPGEPVPANPATAAGLILMNYRNGPPDYDEAIKHFTGNRDLPPENVPNTDPIALHRLGLIYEQGLGVPRDHDKAMAFFEQVKDSYGDVFYYHAADALHRWQASKDSVAADDSQRDAAKGASLGNVRAKNLSAQWIQYNAERNRSLTAVEKTAEYRKANQLWKEASAAGDAQATYFLGMAAMTGEGMPKDPAAAVELIERAADANNASAQERYGVYLISGENGVPKDVMAGRSFLEAAAGSEPKAANELAVSLWHDPDPKSHGLAIKKWLQESFDDGYWVAGRNLAKYYHVGLGGTKNEAQARDYLEKAAKRGGKDGAKVAMDAYTKGDCVNANPAAAARWKAAAGL